MRTNSARSILLAWFAPDVTSLGADYILRGIAGVEPDLVQANRTPTRAKPFFSSATVSRAPNEISVSVSPGRIDLHIRPEDPDTNAGAPMTFDAREALESVLDPIRSGAGPAVAGIYRFSVVCNFIDLFVDARSANAEFLRIIGSPELDPDVLDLRFQINRRFSISSLQCEANRILSLNTENIQTLEVPAVPGAVIDVSKGRVVQEFFTLSSTFDFNVVPKPGRTFDPSEVASGLTALSDEALRLRGISTLGDFL